MSAEQEPNVIAWIGAAVAAVFGWLFKTTMGRISDLEKNKLEKTDFQGYVERADESRKETRESIVKLFDKIDEVKDLIRESGRGG